MTGNNYRGILALTVLLSLLHTTLAAAEDASFQQPDTSYFLPGEDDHNLLEAVTRNDPVATGMLLARGADPDAVSSTGNTALIYAAEKRNMEIMRMLIGAGASVNATGYKGATPLFMAIFNNDFQAAKYLLEQGADANVKDDFGVTPLLYAAATNQYQSADLLMFYGADDTVTDEDGNDPLMTAVTFENIETSDVLLQNDLDPDTRDNAMNTPAIVAVQHGRKDILQLLLDYDADVNIANNRNYTPLAYAITYDDEDITELLVKNGADVHHQVDHKRNMTDLARINGNTAIIDLLEEKGGKPSKGTDFSEFRLTYGNSFNATDYLMQFRGGLTDIKHGWYFETGIDYRPFLLRVHTYMDDTLYQFRERRIGWSHSAGKYFNLVESGNNFRLGAYGSVTGLLSFINYMGTSRGPALDYRIIPSAGLTASGKYMGVRAGLDWYQFDNLLDRALKFNVALFFRISYPEQQFDRKEINWD